MSTEDLENGLSPLDGILPSDLGGDCFDDLFEKSENNVVNGVVNHGDSTKMNGDVGGKRMLGEYVDNSPAKRQALDTGVTGVVVTNGGHGNGSLNGSGQQSQQIYVRQSGGNGQAAPVIVTSGDKQMKQVVYLQQSDGRQQTMIQRPAGPGQQTVVRVTAPVAQVAPAQQPGDHLPQVDGADDDTGDGGVPQVDGTTGDPASSSSSSDQPSSSSEPGQESSSVPQQSSTVIQRPASTPTPPAPSSSSSPPAPAASAVTAPVQGVSIDTKKPFMCEWSQCMMAFKTPKEVENHAIASHCPLGSDDIPCLWARCDGMKRKRFSLMTHLQDRHCHPQVNIIVKVKFTKYYC